MFKKKISVLLSTLIVAVSLTGCIMKPYDKPEFQEVAPDETAFLIPMEGQTSEQGKFQSEDFLKSNLIAAKRIQIPHKWQQEGRLATNGKYVPTARLIKISRKPASREWTADPGNGSTAANQSITAESKDSIGFAADFTVTGQIDEADAPKFLYLYSGLQLDGLMDGEVRNRISSKFVEECAKYSLGDLLANKSSIMKVVRDDVIPYFKSRGVNITSIGLVGEFTYLNKEIQLSIDNTFKKAKELEAQKAENQKLIEKQTAENTAALDKAKADAEVARTQASTITQTIELRKLEIAKLEAEAEVKKAEAMKEWKNLTTITNGSSILNLK